MPALTTGHVLPIRRVPGYLRQVRADSLVRNSLYLMTATAVTAGLGYVFWAVAAHAFTRQEIGTGSAVISLCSTAALFTYLGPAAMLIERLPALERSSRWSLVLARVCTATAAVTVAATGAAIPVLIHFQGYREFFAAPPMLAITLLGAASWTIVNLLCSAFISARRAGRLLTVQSLMSAAKLIIILPLATAGAASLVGAWAASAVLGTVAGAAWLIPGLGLGRPGRSRQRAGSAPARARPAGGRRARHRRPPGPGRTVPARRLLGQHLTGVGGAVTPQVLPVLVVLRLGAAQNADFYIAWMVGGVFFMVSPAVAAALFAEGVRGGAGLSGAVSRALRVIIVLLAPAIVVMIVWGRLVLGLFGTPYAAAGYWLVVLLALSALPDAVSNVAVAVFRVTHRVGYSAALNLTILAVTVACSWLLMPRLGIAGVGVAWLGAQIAGAIASLPAYTGIRQVVTA